VHLDVLKPEAATGDTAMTAPSPTDRDPRHHTANIKNMLSEAREHCREDVSRVDDAKAQALFEVTAEVLQGLIKAYEDYEKRAEAAWK
jgi:hypothetical protein